MWYNIQNNKYIKKGIIMKHICNFFILFFLSIAIFGIISVLNPITELKSQGQWNNNPEETNDAKLYKYEVMLDEGIVTEQMVFEEIVYCNNLTDQGVQDLINDGYLHSYIDALIEAGRLPQGFTPTTSVPETPPVEESQTENIPTNSSTEQTGNSETQTQSTPAPETVTCDETVTGTYVIIKAETKGYASYSTSSSKVKTWALGETVDVTGLTSNGYYRVNDNSEQFIKESNLVKKDLYDAAWTETNRIESSCTEEGSVSYTNTYTDESKTEIIGKVEHKMEVIEKTAASCETDGIEKLKCSMCELEQENTIVATGHKAGFVCSNCNQVILFEKAFSPAVVGCIATITVLSLVGGSFLVFRKFKR